MSSIPRCEAASISTTSSDVPFAIVTHALQVLSGFGVGPCAQLRPFARMRASDVLPVPRGRAKRYACRTCPEEIAFLSVRTIASCPTTSSKSCGRYFRYSAATAADLTRGGRRSTPAPRRAESLEAARLSLGRAVQQRCRIGARVVVRKREHRRDDRRGHARAAEHVPVRTAGRS